MYHLGRKPPAEIQAAVEAEPAADTGCVEHNGSVVFGALCGLSHTAPPGMWSFLQTLALVIPSPQMRSGMLRVIQPQTPL